jgi:hypothetical protein
VMEGGEPVVGGSSSAYSKHRWKYDHHRYQAPLNARSQGIQV